VVNPLGALAEHGRVATLKSDSQCIYEELLNQNQRGTGKLSIASTGGNTTDELLEVLTKGPG